jgi:hypothetical protein
MRVAPLPSKPELSTWLGVGTFYLAPTHSDNHIPTITDGAGHEENTEPENLIWNWRACNTRLGVVFKDLGIGRRTRQFSPGEGAKSLGQWLTAVMSMKGG